LGCRLNCSTLLQFFQSGAGWDNSLPYFLPDTNSALSKTVLAAEGKVNIGDILKEEAM